MPHKSVMYHMKTVWARLCTCAISVVLQFWDAAAVWEAFRWDHPDDETPPARTANSLKFLWVTTVHLCGCNSRQEHYANRAGAQRPLWPYDDFFSQGIKAKVRGNSGHGHRHEIPSLVGMGEKIDSNFIFWFLNWFVQISIKMLHFRLCL